MNFMGLTSADEITGASLCTEVIDPKVLDVVPIEVMHPLMNVIEISDGSDSLSSFDNGGTNSRVLKMTKIWKSPWKIMEGLTYLVLALGIFLWVFLP